MEDTPTLTVEVKTISIEYVKPSNPTPSHLENFNLSYVDQILPLVPPFLTSGLLFYATTIPKSQLRLHITCLKTSLSKTLSKFYPLAGRVKQSTITCDDHGIPFVEAEVNCSLSTVLNSTRKLELTPMFLPAIETLGITAKLRTQQQQPSSSEVIKHITIQLTAFTCGGIAIGWYDIHKVMDGTSSATFFKHWAANAMSSSCQYYNNGHLLADPDFLSTITAFPPSPKPDLLPLIAGYEDHILVKSFIFSSVVISELKASAASKRVPTPSSYEALAGFMWEQLQVLSPARSPNDDDDTVLQVTVDMRPNMNPPLPTGSMGNLVNTAVARANKRTGLPDLVAEIRAAISEMKADIKENYHHGEKGVKAVRGSWNKLITTLEDYNERTFKVVSWCKLGFTDLDFGFGKPKWMVPTDGVMSAFHKNLIILNNCCENGGIEAWLFLDKKDMNILESNRQFLAFAFPTF